MTRLEKLRTSSVRNERLRVRVSFEAIPSDQKLCEPSGSDAVEDGILLSGDYIFQREGQLKMVAGGFEACANCLNF